MKIGFYGAGRVGCTLGRYLKEHGAQVTGYYNRTGERALDAAQKVQRKSLIGLDA